MVKVECRVTRTGIHDVVLYWYCMVTIHKMLMHMLEKSIPISVTLSCW